MATVNTTVDVFISHTTNDAALASDIAVACRSAGLEAVTNSELMGNENDGDAVWEALSKSRAFITVLSPSAPSTSMAVEIGAARAWNKPIFGVVTDPSRSQLPAGFAGIHLYTSGRIEDVINAVKASIRQLSNDDRAILKIVYRETGVPVDQFFSDPERLDDLVKSFVTRSGKSVAAERLLSELLRIVKNSSAVPRRT